MFRFVVCRRGRRRRLEPKLREEVDANQSYGELHDILCDVVHGAGQDGTTKASNLGSSGTSNATPERKPLGAWKRWRLERRRRPVEPSKIGIKIVIMARILPEAIQDCTYQNFNDTNKFEDIVEAANLVWKSKSSGLGHR